MPATEKYNIRVFDENAREYDDWFDHHPAVFESELRALKSLLPQGRGVEIGAGTGRFAVGLGIKVGVEPSPKMASIAQGRGLEIHQAFAEKLPFEDGAFDFALMATVLCFLPDPVKALEETRRILKPGGLLLTAFIDRESLVGRSLPSPRSKYYREAFLHSSRDMMYLLSKGGYVWMESRQTLFSDPQTLTVPDIPKPGFGDGDFVVFLAEKPLADL